MKLDLKEWIKRVTNTINDANKEKDRATGTLTLYNCTGTISHNQLEFIVSKSGAIYVQGRININSFARTGTNPGVTIALPLIVATPKYTRSYMIGFRAQNPREALGLNMTANSRNVSLTTYESFQNAQNGTLTFIVSGRIFVE